VGDALGVALDGDGGGEAGNGDGALELGEGVAHGLLEPVAGGEEADDGTDDEEDCETAEDAAYEAAAFGLARGFLGGEGLVWNYVGIGEMRQTHGLMASVNGAGREVLRVFAERQSRTGDLICFTGVGAIAADGWRLVRWVRVRAYMRSRR